MAGRVALLIAVALAAACAGADDEPVAEEPWGVEATHWWTALEEAHGLGPEVVSRFLDPGLVWEDRILGQIATSDEEWLTAQVDRSPVVQLSMGPSFLVSADEILGQFETTVGYADPLVVGYPDDPRFWLSVEPYLNHRVYHLDRLTIGPEGVTNWVVAQSLVDCRFIDPARCQLDAEALAERYAAWWSGAADHGTEPIYTDDAVIFDTLLGRSISSVDAIDAATDSSSWPSLGTVTLADRPGMRGPAVYIAPSEPDWAGAAEITFLVDADDGSGCPGRVGVAVALERGRIVWERRYHDIDSIRRCADVDTLRTGWWERLEAAEPMTAMATGTISVGGRDVAVFNGTPELDDFLRWGIGRYETAGLAVPVVDSVTFLDGPAFCSGARGRATANGASRINLCAGVEEICADETCTTWTTREQFLWLHELAHPWLAAHVDEPTRAAFLEHVRLARWADPDDTWWDRGVERAANTLAFGLLQERANTLPAVDGTCAERDAGFRILTGTDPIAPCTE